MPDLRAMVTIYSANFGTYALPDPKPGGYIGTTETAVDGGLNLYGEFIGQVVRDGRAKVELQWFKLTPQKWGEILRLFSIQDGGAFINQVEFFDQVAADWITKRMYINNQRTTGGAAWRNPQTGIVEWWNEPRLALIEV